MAERNDGKPEWQVVNRHGGGRLEVKELDPEFQPQMPVSGRTILQVGPIESVVIEIKKFIQGEPNTLG